jgi:predicted MPP superfamily phosphohydrolase
MLIRLILLIATAVIVLGGANWFVYFSLYRLLSIQSIMIRLILGGALFVVTFGFLAMSAISRSIETTVVKYLYLISAILIGVWVFVLFSLIITWIIIGIANLAGISISHQVVVWVMLAIALIYSTYNIYNAYDIKIKNIDVTIKNLPEQWKGKTIVQLSDIHLGNINGPGFMQKIADMTNAQKPDVIAITGDLFDGADGNLSPLIAPINSLKASMGIYFISGNHELYLGLDKALEVINKTDIQFIDDDVVNNDGLQFVGVAYGQDFVTQNVKKILEANKNYDKNIPTVLLYHIPLPAAIAEAKQMGIGLQLSGHTHVGQLLPFKFITDIIYKGYDYGLFKEGDFTLYTSSGVGTWGPPMRSGNHPEIVVVHLK